MNDDVERNGRGRWSAMAITTKSCAGLLVIVAAGVVLLAVRMRDTAQLIEGATLPGVEVDPSAAAYQVAFFFNLFVAVALLLVAWALNRAPGRFWFGITAGSSLFPAVAGVWAIVNQWRVAGAGVAMSTLSWILIGLAAVTLASAMMGLAASPPLPLRRPTNPPVPPHHENG